MYNNNKNNNDNSNQSNQSDQFNQSNNDIAIYRQKQAFKHHLLTKYKKLLEFNKQTRDEWRLTNFAKKKILFDVCNLTQQEINQIEGKYRFRCYIIDYDDVELFEILEFFEIQKEAINLEEDNDLKNIMLESLQEEKNNQVHKLSKSKKSIRLPVMIDLRVYGLNPEMPICVNNKLYYFDDKIKQNITRSFNLVNTETFSGENFEKMLKVSKILRDSYFNETNKFNVTDRVNQKMK